MAGQSAIQSLCSARAADAISACASWQAATTGEKLYTLTLIATAVSIISTVLLLLTVWLAFRATKAATRATDIAAEGMAESIKTNHVDQRPYIFWDRWEVISLFNGDDEDVYCSYRVNLHWKNTGKSIAHEEWGVISWQKFDIGSFPSDFKFEEAPFTHKISVGPGSTWFVYVEIPLQDWVDVFKGRSEIHIWASVNYSGAQFEKYRTEKHVLAYPGRRPGRSELTLRLSDARLFNGADQSCFRVRT